MWINQILFFTEKSCRFSSHHIGLSFEMIDTCSSTVSLTMKYSVRSIAAFEHNSNLPHDGHLYLTFHTTTMPDLQWRQVDSRDL